jgi:hypothetical protein
VDSVAAIQLVSDLANSSQSGVTNPIVQLLASGNQNIVGQVLTSISQQFNRMNDDMVDNAISSNASLAPTEVDLSRIAF